MTCYYKEYDMVTWNDLELRNKPVRTRFVHKKNGQNRETYILEWSSTRELVKLSDGEWYKVSDVVVLDYLNGLHMDYLSCKVYDRFVTTPWIPRDPLCDPYSVTQTFIGNITPVMFTGDPGDVLRSSSTTSQVLS